MTDKDFFDEYPSLRGMILFSEERKQIENGCLDKQKVKEAIEHFKRQLGDDLILLQLEIEDLEKELGLND